MLSKKNKADRKTIEKIFKKGIFVNSTNLTLRFLYTKDNHLPRVSFIVPKTVAKMAVTRNLLKRRGYHLAKSYLNTLPRGFVGVIIFGKKSLSFFSGRKSKTRNPVHDLGKEIEEVFNKL